MRPIIILSCVALALLIFQQQPKESNQSAIAQEEVQRSIAPPLVDDRLDQVLSLLKVQSSELAAIEECQQQESRATQSRLVALESSSASGCDCDCEGKLADLESRVKALEAVKVALNKVSNGGSNGGSVGSPVVSYGSAGSAVAPPLVVNAVRTPVRTVVSGVARNVANVANYQPRWQNYDGKSRMQHAVEDHGMDISGKSQAQILAEMDAYHDQYGPGHPVKSRVMNSSCPGGVCPTGRSVQTRSSGSGWFLGKNLRR
jgi:hypothetical protein